MHNSALSKRLAHALVPREPIAPVDPGSAVRTSHHRLVLFPEMESMLRALNADADAARRRIWIETYIFRHDRLGRAFAETLARAAARGVDVRLLYDPLGCNETDPAFFDELRARGIVARAYRPTPVGLRERRWWPRDHSRIIVVDDHAYTGGAAWGDEWLPRSLGGHGWHDVCTRVGGPCVRDFAHAFRKRWSAAVGDAKEPDVHATGDKYPDLEFVTDSPRATNEVFRRYLERIRRARSRIWIENSYFFPTADLLSALYDAADRGVDVRVILPGETDLPILHRAARAEYADWIDHGLALFEYARSILHAKYALIDDDWATVGTYNVSAIGMLWANEANLFVYDRAYVARVAAAFVRDLSHCDAVDRHAVARRPLLEQVADVLSRDVLSVIETFRDADL